MVKINKQTKNALCDLLSVKELFSRQDQKKKKSAENCPVQFGWCNSSLTTCVVWWQGPWKYGTGWFYLSVNMPYSQNKHD